MKTILICVQSIDGKIARGKTDQIDWTSKEDRKFFAQATKKIGVVIMGSKTFESIGRVLPERLNIVLTSKAKQLVSKDKNLIYSDKKPKALIAQLHKQGVTHVAIIGGSTINAAFLKAKLINEIWLTIEGVVLGKGVSLFDDAKYTYKAKLISSKRLSSSGILLKYQMEY